MTPSEAASLILEKERDTTPAPWDLGLSLEYEHIKRRDGLTLLRPNGQNGRSYPDAKFVVVLRNEGPTVARAYLELEKKHAELQEELASLYTHGVHTPESRALQDALGLRDGKHTAAGVVKLAVEALTKRAHPELHEGMTEAQQRAVLATAGKNKGDRAMTEESMPKEKFCRVLWFIFAKNGQVVDSRNSALEAGRRLATCDDVNPHLAPHRAARYVLSDDGTGAAPAGSAP